MLPNELATILSSPSSPCVSPFSLTSSSCDSVTSRTPIASSLWSAARAIADEQIIISFRSRLLSLTIRMYSSITGRRGKPSVSDAR